MADPHQTFSERNSDPTGVGPFQFDVAALAVGETHVIDLRERENGKYVDLSPAGYDSVEVQNVSTEPLIVRINEHNTLSVPGNTTQSLSLSGMYRFDITNEGSGATDAGDVSVEVLKEPFGDDQLARQRATESPLRGVLRHFMGV